MTLLLPGGAAVVTVAHAASQLIDFIDMAAHFGFSQSDRRKKYQTCRGSTTGPASDHKPL
jgi:hypothetical protein